MKPLRCLAVDDESHAIELLQLYAQKCDMVDMVAATSDPWEARRILEGGEIDLVFLDIQMPELTGLQLLDLAEGQFKVIITSAYTEYAIEGYRYAVSDYLLKPFSYDRFEEAVRRVASAESLTPSKEAPQHLLVKGDSKNSYEKVVFEELLYVEALKNYLRFYTADQKVMTLMTMSELETKLPSNFIRVHRSYIVNLDKVDKIEGNSLTLAGKNFPIGKTHREEVFRRLGL
ncbi:LytR/AlgR family response regulator transcription factor [Sanyastnella coralliicola]|uniref:LytR/AlgR family response regulator transcription factor n=1 Tax=Sanyastnella coralliicola TaxID=3069118 RepID=UPI0027BAA8CC|nr:LytTR family DNA-binding domain-containing protein [Longitalea sp. SCSIO 12813]